MTLVGEQPLFNTELVLARPPHELYEAGVEGPHHFRYIDDDQLLVRDIWKSDLVDPSAAEASLMLSQAHHRLLGSLGINVISYYQAVIPEGVSGSAATDNDGTVEDFIAAHAVVPYIKNSRPLLNENNETIDIGTSRLEQELANPLYRYIMWCRRERQKYYLADIYSLNQYSVHVPSGALFLHDIDPLMLILDNDYSNQALDDINRLKLGLPMNVDS